MDKQLIIKEHEGTLLYAEGENVGKLILNDFISLVLEHRDNPTREAEYMLQDMYNKIVQRIAISHIVTESET